MGKTQTKKKAYREIKKRFEDDVRYDVKKEEKREFVMGTKLWETNQRGSWSVTCPRTQLWAPGMKLRMYHKRAPSCRMTASSVTSQILSCVVGFECV